MKHHCDFIVSMIEEKITVKSEHIILVKKIANKQDY